MRKTFDHKILYGQMEDGAVSRLAKLTVEKVRLSKR